MPEAKISVIVPVYKVEPYLRKCLDSIVGQTYRNLEIILVDDGSPDNCGAICDEYAARDERIKVIHKENGGVASARNAGLAMANGDYIGWIDSDDWIETDMLEFLLEGAQRHGADIAVCGRVEVYPTRQVPLGWENEKILDAEQAIGFLLEDDLLRNYLCDKLWRRELFQDICFPEGRNFEDVAVTYRLIEKAEKIVCLPGYKYFYLQREDGIVRSSDIHNNLAYYRAEQERYLYLRERYPQFQEQMEIGLVLSVVHTWEICQRAPAKVRRRYHGQLMEMSAFARNHPTAVDAVAQNLGLAGRIILRLTPYARPWVFALARWVSKLYEWKHGTFL